ncbi:protein-disulfide reductase DsbD N-terminal domain-containing protein, partial [Psychrobacter sp.]|uniref:protein-disulfide reductase DsbD N-terminal domain-containing protein n=1 Tax=Psychrobacter sp. TaxID=56811 RepID=UPI0025EAA49E
MKNSVKIKDTISTQIIKKSQMLSVKNEGYSKAKRIIDIAHKTLAVSLVLAVNVGFSAVSGSGQAKAAGLADLFNDAEVQGGEQKFLKVEQAFNVQPSQSGNKINIALKITPKYYLYKDKLILKLPDGVTASAIKFSQPSQTIDDPSFGKVNVFKQLQLTATTTLTNTTANAINQDITISWQGCAEAGLCYPPQKETLSISLPAGTTKAVEPRQNTTKTSKTNQVEQTPNDSKTNNASKLAANESQVKAVTASSNDNNLTQSGQQQGQAATSAITVTDDSIDEGSLAKSDSLINNDKAQDSAKLDTLQDQDQASTNANANANA